MEEQFTNNNDKNQERSKVSEDHEELVASSEETEESEQTAPINKLGDNKKEEDFKAKFYYLAAEMENSKKRFEREKENLRKFSNERILTDLVEVVDNFFRTLKALQNDSDEKVKNIVTGINMVNNQLNDVLNRFGLSPVESVGKIFDPNLHEAVEQRVVEGKKDQEIIEEYQKGYILNGRLLRPAKVAVIKQN